MVEAVKNKRHDGVMNANEDSQQELRQGSRGKAGSTANSYKQGRGPKSSTGQLSQGTGRAQNIVIDIESEDLTYNQARSIRLQIQRDVEQLRNRVRMLQQEEVRALKKIQETRKKTQQITELQAKNDAKYRKAIDDKHRKYEIAEKQKRLQQARRDKESTEIRYRGDTTVKAKLAVVEEVRQQKQIMKQSLYGMREDNYMKAQERKDKIKNDRAVGLARQNEFIRKKVANARLNVDDAATNLKEQISNYESEAQQLERMEAELLGKLQETQKAERDAFGRLESAMVDASIPKHMRKAGEQSVMKSDDGDI